MVFGGFNIGNRHVLVTDTPFYPVRNTQTWVETREGRYWRYARGYPSIDSVVYHPPPLLLLERDA